MKQLTPQRKRELLIGGGAFAFIVTLLYLRSRNASSATSGTAAVSPLFDPNSILNALANGGSAPLETTVPAVDNTPPPVIPPVTAPPPVFHGVGGGVAKPTPLAPAQRLAVILGFLNSKGGPIISGVTFTGHTGKTGSGTPEKPPGPPKRQPKHKPIPTPHKKPPKNRGKSAQVRPKNRTNIGVTDAGSIGETFQQGSVTVTQQQPSQVGGGGRLVQV